MSTTSNQRFVRKTTALLSAIAAGSFLGLPVLAQTNPGSGNSSVQCVPSSTQSRGSYSISSMSSNTTSSNTTSSNTTSSSAEAPGNRAYPNQPGASTGATPSSTDDLTPSGNLTQSTRSSRNTSTSAADDSGTPGVREYPNQSDPRTGVNSSSTSGAAPSTNNPDVTAGTTSNSGDQTANNGPRSGDVPSGNSITRSRTNTSQSEVQSVAPVGSQGQVGANGSVAQSSPSSTPDSNSSSYSRSNDVYRLNRSAMAQSNATSGAQAGNLLDQGTRNRAEQSDIVSYGYGRDQSQLPTSGVTSGAQTTNQGQIIARCPEGTVPSYQSVPRGINQDQNQFTPDRNSVPREQTAPDVQTPGR